MTMCLTLFALVGVVNIITRSVIMEGVREKAPWAKVRYMLNCPQCTGFWVGVAYSVYLLYAAPNCAATFIDTCLSMLLWGGFVSLGASIVVPLLDYLAFAKTLIADKIMNSTPHEINENPHSDVTNQTTNTDLDSDGSIYAIGGKDDDTEIQ